MCTEQNQSDSAPAADVEPLGAEVLAHTLRQIRSTYCDYNASLFAGRLVTPTFEWTNSAAEWGAWVRSERVLRLSTRLVDGSWGELTEVLKHEMAHQYVEEVLGERAHEGPHGATFQRVCRERAIDASAAGALRNDSSDEPPHYATLKRIEHLLALAGSDNRHEAETAMATARRLMLKYNLEQAAVESPGRYTFRHLGKPTGRRMAWQRSLANILSEFFFVDVIIVPVYRPREKKRGSVIEAVGTPANLDIASYAHDFLDRTALALWNAHRGENGLASDRDKQSYLYGVMAGFSAKLRRDAKKHERQGLVWLSDPELGRYFRARHPHVRSVAGRARVSQNAYAAGHDAGSRIVLHRGVDAPSTRARARLLGAGSKS